MKTKIATNSSSKSSIFSSDSSWSVDQYSQRKIVMEISICHIRSTIELCR